MKFENKVLVDKIFGNGRLAMALWFLDTAPKFYIVRIDCSFAPDDESQICPPELTEFMQEFDDDVFAAIAEQFDECYCDGDCDCSFPTLVDGSCKYKMADRHDLKGFEL